MAIYTEAQDDGGTSTIPLFPDSGCRYCMGRDLFARQCAYAVTISGVIWGIIVFSEQHSIWIWISVMVMLLGLALVSPDQKAEVEDGNNNATADSAC